MTTTIYVKLMDEGVQVWRPVQASLEPDGNYRVQGPVPDLEAWEFQPESIVAVKNKIFQDGSEGLVAVLASDKVACEE